MKRLLLLLLGFLALGMLSVAGQQPPEEGARGGMRPLSSQHPATGISRAVVIGISDYDAPGIRDLQFAHKDARAFADFLMSEAGGSLPAENIRLLLNDQATLAAVDDALYWLRTRSEPGDKAILYFAGHGDVETDAHWQFGYLLTHDSPANNFRNNAVRVEDLDILAIELSSVREVKTVFYIDACRSGTLAEGRQVPHTHLAKQRANEVRILSCQPDQLSLEGPQWGGGRGAFSWHLIRGLQGLAMDPTITRDELQVTVEELEEFLKGTLVKETRDLNPDKRQDPVVAGPRAFPLATVVPDILAAAKAGFDLQAPEFAMLVSRSIREEDPDAGTPESPLASLFAVMRAGDVWRQMDLAAFRDIPREDLAGVLFQSIRAEAHAYDLEATQASELQRAAGHASASLVDSASRIQAAQHIALALHNAGQVLINRYLSADPKELAERSYYHYRHARYRQDPELFRLALNLLPEDHPLHPRVAVKAAYFEGLSLRVQGFFDEDPESRYQQALEAQLAALKRDDKAPYIHNELGILYKLTNQPALAEQHFRAAAVLAPSWSLPIANLCGMLTDQQRFDEAWQMAEKGLGMGQPNYLLHYHTARLYEQAGNRLLAEDHFQQALRLDTAHFAAYARLGQLYLNTSEYPLADRAIELAVQKGMMTMAPQVNTPLSSVISMVDQLGSSGFEHPQPFLDRIARDPADTEAHFKLAMIYWNMGKPRDAEVYFRKLLALDPLYPWLWDQFAWFLYQQERYPEAWRAMEKAPEMPDLVESQQAFRALILERMGRKEEAAARYREILNRNPSRHGLRPRLWKILEERGQWVEAERQMMAFEAFSRQIAEHFRLGFYRRMQERFPDDREWLRRQLAILFERCLTRAREFEVMEEPFHPDRDKVESLYQGILEGSTYTVIPVESDWPSNCREPEQILAALLAGETQPAERMTWLRQLAQIRECYQDFGKAWEYLEEVLREDPDDHATREKLARVYQGIHRTALAREHFAYLHKQGLLRYPDHYALARAYTHAWDFSPASWLLREAETQSLEPEVTFRNREIRSRAKLIAGDWAGAWPVYQELQREFPDAAPVCYTLARLAMHTEQPDQAWQWLDRALAKGFSEIYVLAYDPLMAPLRGDDGWQKLMKKYGLNIPGQG
jgi:Tfp pilus assembly protein PilF